MKSRLVLPIALVLSLALLISSCALADNPFASPRGSCNYIGGTTASTKIKNMKSSKSSVVSVIGLSRSTEIEEYFG